MTTTCMYDRDEECFCDCIGCLRAVTKTDPDDERDCFLEDFEYDDTK